LVKITINDLTFSYNSSAILDGLDLVVQGSEVLGLVGPTDLAKPP